MSQAISKAAKSLDRKRRKLFENPGADLCASLSALFDDYFRARPGEIAPPRTPFAVAAVGGYGRGELCPASDIDVLILYAGRIPAEAKAVAQALFFPLWDLGLELGHGVRAVGECLKLARTDWQVFASLLDARLLWGDE